MEGKQSIEEERAISTLTREVWALNEEMGVLASWYFADLCRKYNNSDKYYQFLETLKKLFKTEPKEYLEGVFRNIGSRYLGGEGIRQMMEVLMATVETEISHEDSLLCLSIVGKGGGGISFFQGVPGGEQIAKMIQVRQMTEEATGKKFDKYHFHEAYIIQEQSQDPLADMKILLSEEAWGNEYAPLYKNLERYYQEGHKFVGSVEALLTDSEIEGLKKRTFDRYRKTPEEIKIGSDEFEKEKKTTIVKRDIWRKLAKVSPTIPEESRVKIAGKLIELELVDRGIFENILDLVDEIGGLEADYNLLLELIYASFPDYSPVGRNIHTKGSIGKIITTIANTPKRKEIRKLIAVFCDLVKTGLDMEEFVGFFEAGELDRIQKEIYSARLKRHAMEFPEKPLDQVYEAFLTPETPESEVVSKETMDRAMEIYTKILAEGEKYIQMSDKQIRNIAGKIRKKAQRPDFKIDFFAIARELFKREFGIYPYNTQILAILLLLDDTQLSEDEKGIYVQIKTGEGKSLVFALFSSYLAVQGRKVDIVTSNNYLAERDAAKFKQFQKNFDIEIANFSFSGLFGGQNMRGKDIIYTTSPELVFQFMHCGLEGTEFFGGDRLDAVLIDEADNLCLDLLQEGCKMGEYVDESGGDVGMGGKITGFVYTPGLEEIKKEGGKALEEVRKNDITANVRMFEKIIEFVDTHGLEEIKKDWGKALEEFRKDDVTARYKGDDYLKIHMWTAAESQRYKKDVHFIVRNEEIIIVDVENTGRLKPSHQWSFGLHEFVAIRNGLKLPRQMKTSAQMTHPHLLRKYNNLFCISGTFGGEIDRREIAEIYKLKGFDVPSHYDCIREDIPVRAELWGGAFIQRIKDRIEDIAGQGRSVLAIMESIAKAKIVREILDGNLDVQFITDAINVGVDGEEKTEAELVGMAGKPGVVTISTNVSGRGTDIIQEERSIEAGGGHALLGFFPRNLRIEYQNRGRVGRQGKPGSSEIIIDMENDPFISKMTEKQKKALYDLVLEEGPDSELISALMEFFRKYKNLSESKLRIAKYEQDTIIQKAVSHYFKIKRTRFPSFKIGSISDFPCDRGKPKAVWEEGFEELQHIAELNVVFAQTEELSALSEEDEQILEKFAKDCFGNLEVSDCGRQIIDLFIASAGVEIQQTNSVIRNMQNGEVNTATEKLIRELDKIKTSIG